MRLGTQAVDGGGFPENPWGVQRRHVLGPSKGRAWDGEIPQERGIQRPQRAGRNRVGVGEWGWGRERRDSLAAGAKLPLPRLLAWRAAPGPPEDTAPGLSTDHRVRKAGNQRSAS